MPEGKENNCLDREELQGWVIRPQKLLGGRVEEEESKEGDRDANVVDQGGVEVALGNLPSALVIFAPSLGKIFRYERHLAVELERAVTDLQDDDNNAEDRLEEAELEGSLLAKPKRH